jgi:hypothetical protein
MSFEIHFYLLHTHNKKIAAYFNVNQLHQPPSSIPYGYIEGSLLLTSSGSESLLASSSLLEYSSGSSSESSLELSFVAGTGWRFRLREDIFGIENGYL